MATASGGRKGPRSDEGDGQAAKAKARTTRGARATKENDLEENEEEDEQAPKAKKGGAKEKQDKNMKLLAKGVAHCLQQGREHESVLYDVVLVPSDNTVPKEMKVETQKWDKDVKAKGKGHGCGPPHLRAWSGLIAGLMKSDVGARNKERLLELEKLTSEATAMERDLMIRACKAKVCYDKDMTKIAIALQGKAEPYRDLIVGCLEQIGGSRKSGRAPPSNLERSIQNLIDKL